MSTAEISVDQAQEIYETSLAQLKEAAINLQISDEHILILRRSVSDNYNILQKLQRKKKYGIFAFLLK